MSRRTRSQFGEVDEVHEACTHARTCAYTDAMLPIKKRQRQSPDLCRPRALFPDGFDHPDDTAAQASEEWKPFDKWERLSDDIVLHIMSFLGMDALNLKQVSRHFANCKVSDGLILALRALRCEPNRSDLRLHKSRTPTALCSTIEWTSARFWSGMSHRLDWASLVRIIDAAPINTVIDAFLLIPKVARRNAQVELLEGMKRFISHCVSKPYPIRSTSPVTTVKAPRIAAFDTYMDQWEELSSEEKSWFIRPGVENVAKANGEHTRAIRAVLHKCIEARLWNVICCEDVTRTEPTCPVVAPMSEEFALRTVKRMFDPSVNVHNGSTSFFYTPYGWLGLSPFLLAAERQNLALVKHLCETCDDPSLTVGSRSYAGNDAYALCEAHLLEKLRYTPREMEGSKMLQYLREKLPAPKPWRCEYAAWCGE